MSMTMTVYTFISWKSGSVGKTDAKQIGEPELKFSVFILKARMESHMY